MTNARGRRTMVVAAIFLGLGLVPRTAQLCKDRRFPKTIPSSILIAYPHAYVVEIGVVVYERPPGFYPRPVSLQGRIVRSLRGRKRVGDSVDIRTTDGEARARCPIQVATGKRYLFLLAQGSDGTLTTPLYGGWVVSSPSELSRAYEEQLSASEHGAGAGSQGSQGSQGLDPNN